MTAWQTIVDQLGLAKHNESEHHPHVPIERAELFHCADCGSTEFEYLNLINALVIATKPLLVLETGTFLGYGTLAIASALKFNGVGRLITLDVDECVSARESFTKYGLSDLIEFVRCDGTEYCKNYAGETFDFMFHDSGGERIGEHEALKSGGKISKGAVVSFHDSGKYRSHPGGNGPLVKYIEESFPKGISIFLSRGIQVSQF